jgi:hypothetical protein
MICTSFQWKREYRMSGLCQLLAVTGPYYIVETVLLWPNSTQRNNQWFRTTLPIRTTTATAAGPMKGTHVKTVTVGTWWNEAKQQTCLYLGMQNPPLLYRCCKSITSLGGHFQSHCNSLRQVCVMCPNRNGTLRALCCLSAKLLDPGKHNILCTNMSLGKERTIWACLWGLQFQQA